jgi:hypothetical protein
MNWVDSSKSSWVMIWLRLIQSSWVTRKNTSVNKSFALLLSTSLVADLLLACPNQEANGSNWKSITKRESDQVNVLLFPFQKHPKVSRKIYTLQRKCRRLVNGTRNKRLKKVVLVALPLVAAGLEEQERMESKSFLYLETLVSTALETLDRPWRHKCLKTFWEWIINNDFE